MVVERRKRRKPKRKPAFSDEKMAEELYVLSFELCSRVCMWGDEEKKVWRDHMAGKFVREFKRWTMVEKLKLASLYFMDRARRDGCFPVAGVKAERPKGWVV